MTAYVDSSVILRVIFGEVGRLASWGEIETRVSSRLVRLECLRTIDRGRVRFGLDDVEVARRRKALFEQLEGFNLLPLDERVLERAEDPFPTTLGSLDAIHLATALSLRAGLPELRFATHDAELALAARATGFAVIGSAW